MTFDIVIIVESELEYNKINLQIEYAKKNIICYDSEEKYTNDTKIYIIICIENKSILNLTQNNSDCNIIYLNDDNLLEKKYSKLPRLYTKLIIPNLSDKYLILDANTFFIKPMQFIENNICLYSTGNEYNKSCFKQMSNMHISLRKMINNVSGICHHMMFEQKYINDLFLLIEKKHKKSFWEIFLKNPDVSEYEIYFNFMLQYYPNNIKIRNLKWNNNSNEPNIDYNYYDFIYLLCDGKKGKKILYQPWGGLGDNLQFSTLPELFYNLGYNVYISNKNAYRNPEIKELVWDKNPFVIGYSDEQENIGSCVRYHYSGHSFIGSIEKMHGFNPINKYPKIYYNPIIKDEFKDCIFIDTTSITIQYDSNKIINCVNKIIDNLKYCYGNSDNNNNNNNNKIYLLKFKKINNNAIELPYTSYYINDIYEYCNIINSCSDFICIYSGGAVLGSAIKCNNEYPKIHCMHSKQIIENNLYYFDNITFYSM